MRTRSPLLWTCGFVAALAGLSGCRMCCNTYDHCGPVVRGGQPVCHARDRAGSVLSTSHVHPEITEEMPGPVTSVRPSSDRLGTRQVAASQSPSRSRLETAPLGPPLKAEDIDPFVRLGIPPENIIAVEDRALSEVDDTSPASEPAAAARVATSPRPLVQPASTSRPGAVSSSSDGWTRLGDRGQTTLR